MAEVDDTLAATHAAGRPEPDMSDDPEATLAAQDSGDDSVHELSPARGRILDDTLAATQTPRTTRRSRAPAAFDRGATIGRYVVLGKLGAGAMGVVYAAYDPDLDRKLAIKLIELRTRDQRGDQSGAQARLQREAQALAKLNHGNVVAVHDVGVHDGRVFVAMEFVEGRTLGEWMRAGAGGRPQPWREVLARFEAAGRGLAAAHGVGLIHRDFKPDNVMLGDDGRVRVMDFGLARAEGSEPDTASTHDDARRELLSTNDLQASSSLPELDSAALTRTGAMMGTPAYMAPEQFMGREVTARSDQFGFCVALYEALYGQRPFAGESVAALAFAVGNAALREPPGDARVPGWLLRVVSRGLAHDPQQRYADMSELLDALRGGETRRRRRLTLLVVGAVGACVAAGLTWRSLERQRAVEACVAAGDRIDELWNPDTRAAARAGLLATELSYAPAVADKLTPWIDAQVETWRSHARDACMRAEVHASSWASWDPETSARAQWCLEDRRVELDVLVAALIDANEHVVQEGVQLASALTPIEPCTDERALQDIAVPEAAQRSELAQLHRELAVVSQLEHVGDYDQGLTQARELRARAEALGWTPTITAARLLESTLLEQLGHFQEAADQAQIAYFEAARADVWTQAAGAALRLADLLGTKLAREREALAWTEHEAMAVAHTHGRSEVREAVRLIVLGHIHTRLGDYELVEDMLEQALAMTEAALGPEHPKLAVMTFTLANHHIARANYARAKPLLERSLAIWEQNLGPDHPQIAKLLLSVGVLHYFMANDDEAMAAYARSLELCDRTLGPEHPLRASIISNIGLVHWAQHDYERARELQEQALAIRRRTLAPDHPDHLSSLNNLGLAYEGLGELERAADIYAESLALHEQRSGPNSPLLANALENLASVHMALEQYEQALVYQQRVLPMLESKFGPDNPAIANLLSETADALGMLGRHAEGLRFAERALAICEGDGEVEAQDLGKSQWSLARLLWEAKPDEGQDRNRALRLAEQAAANLEASDQTELHAEVQRWLATHRQP